MQNLKKPENSEQILLAEIGALLHDLGKLSDEFLLQQSSETTKQNYLFKHNLVLGRSIKFPYSIDNIQFNEEDILSISNEFYEKIECSTSANKKEIIKNIIRDIIKSRYSIIPNDNQINKIYNIILEYYSSNSIKISESLIKSLNSILLNVKGQKITFADILAKHHNGENGKPSFSDILLNIFKMIDGVDSGVDKGSLHKNGKQSYSSTHKSTSFGYEVKLPNLKVSSLETYIILENLLKCFYRGSINVCELRDKMYNRDKIYNIDTSGSNDEIKKEFIEALGDTRRSGNDVTLWDHSYSVASLYKATIAKIIYENKWTEPSKIKWKIIGVQYDKLGLIEKAHKLVDIVAYRKLIEDIDQEIKIYLEEDFPIGNEIYRDESGIYFIGPDIGNDSSEKFIKEEIMDRASKKSDGEVIPYINISEPSRSLVLLTKLLTEAKGNFQLYEGIPIWKDKWDQALTINVQDALIYKSSCNICKNRDNCTTINNGTNLKHSFCKNTCTRYSECVAGGGNKEHQVDICPVCKIHPKCEYQKVCKCCLNRRENRIKDWLPDFSNKKYPTIWIDEIADSNGKVAIITGKFNLDNWLNGELLNTVFSQTLESYANEYKNWNSLFDSLKQELENNEKSEVLRKIAGESYHGQSPRQFYEDLVVDRNPLWDTKLSNWDSANCEKAADLLLLTVFRKHPSPSRLRRIWTSTEDFWIEMQNELKEDQGIYLELESKKNIENRFTRLEVILDEPFPKAKAVYHLKFEKVDLLSYYDGTKFVSIQNLQHLLLHKEDIAKYKQINIKSEDEKDSEYKNYKVKEIKFSEKSYRPFLEILLSPVTFQFIVPANSVPAVLKKITDKYDEEMGNVAGRLPLNLGVVFFDYKTALYAAVNASRRMLNGFEDIELMECSVSNFSKDSSTIDLEVHTKGTRKKKIKLRKSSDAQSRYYFNFLLNSQDEAQKRESFFKTFIDGKKEFLISGSDLSLDDNVKLYPNYFDFEFLDTTARRLEIRYKGHKRIRKSSLMGPRPYLLEEFTSIFEQIWKLFNKPTMTTSQLKNIQENLVKLHMDWKDCENQNGYEEVLKKQIENILVNVGSKNWWNSLAEGENELLKAVCLDKTIFDILEFYNSILKLKPNGDKNE